jgi:HEAT repeat protein
MDDKLLKKEDLRVVKQLRAVGLRVKSIYDLVNSKNSYPQAIPLLIQLLPTIKTACIKEGVVRALTVRESRGLAEPALIASLKSEDLASLGCRWATANALWYVAGREYYDDIVALAQMSQLGAARQPLLWALGRMKHKRSEVIPLLVRLLKDDVLDAHALIALRKLKAKEAVSSIRPFLTDPNPFVRREARKALDACISTAIQGPVRPRSAKTETKNQAVKPSGPKKRKKRGPRTNGHKSTDR